MNATVNLIMFLVFLVIKKIFLRDPTTVPELANECNYSPLEGVRGVEPSLGEGRVRLAAYAYQPIGDGEISLPRTMSQTHPYHPF